VGDKEKTIEKIKEMTGYSHNVRMCGNCNHYAKITACCVRSKSEHFPVYANDSCNKWRLEKSNFNN